MLRILLTVIVLTCVIGCSNADKTYRKIRVRSAEVAAKKADGNSWDYDQSAPDPFFEIWWKGNRIFKSSPKTDTLAPTWESEEFNLIELARTQTIKPRENHSVIRSEGSESLEIKFFDDDSLFNDPIDTVLVDVEKSNFGVHTLRGVNGNITSCEVWIERNE